VQCSLVRVRCGSVQGAVWLSSGCGVVQYRVQQGSVGGSGVALLRVWRGSAPDYTIKAISNFFENLQRFSQLKVHHRCQMEKIFNQKIFHYFFWTVELAYR